MLGVYVSQSICMLQIYNEYAAANHIIYINYKKKVCIKYGDPVVEYGKKLNGLIITWIDNVTHIGRQLQ